MDLADRQAKKKFVIGEIGKCRACRFCMDVCPTYQATRGVETLSAFGRLQTLKFLLTGMLEPDDALVHAIYSCLQCRRCENTCKSKGQNLEICDIIHLGRSLLAENLTKGAKDSAAM